MIKKIYRLLKYKGERLKTFKEPAIKKIQDELIVKQYASNATKLVVVLIGGSNYVTGKERMSGGTISLVSMAEESAKILNDIDKTPVICCILNKELLINKHLNFTNKVDVFRFEQVVTYFTQLQEIIVHIPEFFATHFYNTLTKKDKQFLQKIPFVHINIMNQNIKLMPTPQFVKTLQSISHLTTITTAHQQYCTQYYRNYYGVPLHKLSVWISAEQYFFKPKKEKENLLIYSPDFHQDKEKIINKLQQIKGLQLQMIENLTYTQYKQVISKAKWAITFGEGLDGYFTEPIFSGAISFAVHNKDFFTDDFATLKTVYHSYQDMYNNIANDIAILEEDTMYNNYQQQQYSICHKHYDSKDYKQNIANFYKQDFTFK